MNLQKLVLSAFLLFGLWYSCHGQADYIVVSPGSTVHLSAQPTDSDRYMWFHNGTVVQGEDTAYFSATLSGWYSVLALNAEGCPSDVSDEFQVIFGLPPPTGPERQVFCINAYATVADLEAEGENVLWYTSEVGGEPLESTDFLETGVYYASQTINGVESTERLRVVVSMVDCADILFISKEVDNLRPSVGSTVVFTITVRNNSSLVLTDIVVEEELPSGYFYVSSEATVGMYNLITEQWIIPELQPLQQAVLKLRVRVLENGEYLNRVHISSSIPDDPDDDDYAEAETFPKCLTVYNEFSPNNDGKNDWFTIDCIEAYPGNTLRVYNRWGQLVYEKSPYDNSWDGTAMRGTATIQRGEKLPQGTYFYSLDLGDGSQPLVSWLYLVRE